MLELPIDQYLPEIVDRLRSARAIVIVAEPGAGKTTRVPPAILAAGLLPPEHPNLVMLQPRRVAARASAIRIAQERNWTFGNQVGYHVRFDRKYTDRTRLRVITEGILTRQLLDDSFIDDIGCVVLDEFHERNLNTDLAIAMLAEVRQTVRDDLLIVVMSATLHAEPVATFLGGCPIIRVPGRTFPVQITHDASAGAALVDHAAAATVHQLRFDNAGDILVFLPGADEIRRVSALIASACEEQNAVVLPLHGSLEVDQQTAALAPSRRRKVILATNIAETSLTIEGVTTVIDSGYARISGFDAQRGLDRLELERISQASAAQRAGRAGRTAPGRCIRLWSEKEHATLAAFQQPEIRRVDLSNTVLALHAWGKPDPRTFGWFEAPEEPLLASAERLLAMLGALDGEAGGQITTLGHRMLVLPIHPRLARLLIAAADAEMLESGAQLAAILSERDVAIPDRQTHPRDRAPLTQGSSDLLIRMEMMDLARQQRFSHSLWNQGIDVNIARQIARTSDQLLRIASPVKIGGNAAPGKTGATAGLSHDNALRRLALLAFPDRVCRRRASDPHAGVMVNGGGVRLARESVVTRGDFFLALDARQDQRSRAREALVRIASSVEESWLMDCFPQSIRNVREAMFDEARERVVGLGQTFYRDLLLREDRDAAVTAADAAVVLAGALRTRARKVFEADEHAATFLNRIAFLSRHLPEHSWPGFDDDQLANILSMASRGKRSLEEVRSLPLASLLEAELAYPLDRLVESEAPSSLVVPTGNRLKLQYSTGDQVVLAVRLQELFGLLDTPRIAGGRVAIVLHLLGPNYRPVQVTDDLKSFWESTYPQVRKDLRARYPKHAWPEDPKTATAQAKGRSTR